MNSVRPAIDGENAFPEVQQLITNTKAWFYMVNLTLDERLHFSRTGPRRKAGVQQGNAAHELRDKAVALLQAGVTPDFKVLIWDVSIFIDSDPYAPPLTNLGELSIVRLTWKSVKGLNDAGFIQLARKNGSCAPEDVLLDFFHSYQYIQQQTGYVNYDLLFPSGIHLALQRHEVSVKGSHHQKFVITDQGAWVGGLDFLQDWWDRRDHPKRDFADRFTSEDRGDNPSFKAPHKDPGPRHDTAAIIKGTDALNDLLNEFRPRWEDAIDNRGDYEFLRDLLRERSRQLQGSDPNAADRYAHLADLLRTKKIKDLAKSFSTVTASAAVDAGFVANQVEITATMPDKKEWKGPKYFIFGRYKNKIQGLKSSESLLYIENQYFTDPRIAKAIYDQWKTFRSGLDKPWIIVIPYEPEVPPINLPFVMGFLKRDIVGDEAKNLKWLEIKTGRTFMEWVDNQGWTYKWAVDNALTEVKFNGAEDNDPSKLSIGGKLTAGSEFTLTKPYPVDPVTGNRSINRNPTDIVLNVDSWIAIGGDIMAYTLLARKTPLGPSGVPKRDRGRDMLQQYGIYVHSKSAIFMNRPVGPYWATIGSANLNRRGLDDNGDQDSELNVWWEHKERVDDYRKDLWAEHLEEGNPANLEPEDWVSQGWGNSQNVLKGIQFFKGSVVRLDVVDRYWHLG